MIFINNIDSLLAYWYTQRGTPLFLIGFFMTSTRNRILETLAKKPGATINELAAAVGINAISVRHHLTNLQAAGLVQAEEERHGVGRPRLIYSLTEQGMEKFPTRYLRLTSRLLKQLKSALPPENLNAFFQQIANDLLADYTDDLRGLSMEERLELLKKILSDEGFSVAWQKEADHYEIQEITCPYYKVSQSHPEVCTIDQTLISSILDVPTEQVQCILHGDQHCTYIVPAIPHGEKDE